MLIKDYNPGTHRQFGFSYMGILVLMVIAGISMAGAGLMWHIQLQRAKEQQLLFTGNAIRKAIGSYYAANPTGLGEYPSSLKALLLDKRQLSLKRHLRQLYLDPMGKQQEWALIMQNDRVIGVYSQSTLAPIKVSGFPAVYEDFSNAKTYQDWKFVYIPGIE
ncbi:MAG: type II secretion system protein [Methylophilaceae bacterium]|nr:MAG: type II secretion system protein [Methylophilaceae bacterium]